jgi:tetratricopeptide (TPR) repeat protein
VPQTSRLRVSLAVLGVLAALPQALAAQASPGDSLRALRAALAAATTSHDTAAIARLSEEIGLEHWRADRFDSALVHLLHGRDLAARRADSTSVARMSNSIGSAHYQLGNYDLALQSYVRSLAIRRSEGNAMGQAYLRANIALAYRDWRQFDRALVAADSAVLLAESVGNGQTLGYALNTRASVLVGMRRFAEARDAAERSLAAYYSGTPPISQRDSLSAWSLNVMLLGEADLAEGRAEDALRRFTEIAERAERGNTRRGRAHAALAVARAQEALGRLSDATAALRRAESLAADIGNRNFRLQALGGLSRIAERRGQADVALRYAREADALRDSLFDARTAQRVAAIELEAEAERQRAATQVLATQQVEQAKHLRHQRSLITLGGLLLVLTLAFSFMVVRGTRAVRARERLLAQRNHELQEALAEVQTLSGFIPICANCKNVRDDEGYWRSVEEYLSSRAMAQFSHSICNSCGPKLYGADWDPQSGPTREPTRAPTPHGAS